MVIANSLSKSIHDRGNRVRSEIVSRSTSRVLSLKFKLETRDPKPSIAELFHEASPERACLSDARIAGLLPDRRVDHDESARRINVDRLATDATEREHPPLAP